MYEPGSALCGPEGFEWLPHPGIRTLLKLGLEAIQELPFLLEVSRPQYSHYGRNSDVRWSKQGEVLPKGFDRRGSDIAVARLVKTLYKVQCCPQVGRTCDTKRVAVYR